jgi:hypothetical protein
VGNQFGFFIGSADKNTSISLSALAITNTSFFIIWVDTRGLFRVYSAPLWEVEKVKPNKANSFDKIMVAIAIFALVGFCAALWKIVG